MGRDSATLELLSVAVEGKLMSKKSLGQTPWLLSVKLTLMRLRQENHHEFQVSLGYIITCLYRTCLKTATKIYHKKLTA